MAWLRVGHASWVFLVSWGCDCGCSPQVSRALTLHWQLERYSLSRKTVNARENFWNVYCFATNQMRDETAKDNGQTAAGMAPSSARNLQFSLCISLKKLFFLPQTNTSHLIPSVQDLRVQIVTIYHGTGSRHGR